MLEILNVNFNIISFKSFEKYSKKISVLNEEFYYDDFSKNKNFDELSPTKKNVVRHNLLLHIYVGTIKNKNNHFEIKPEAKSYLECVKLQGSEKARELLKELIMKSQYFYPILQNLSVNPSKVSRNEFRNFLKINDDKKRGEYRYDTASNVITTILGRLNIINYESKRGKKSKSTIQPLSKDYLREQQTEKTNHCNLKEHLLKIGLTKKDIWSMISSLEKDKQEKIMTEQIL
ncbi:MAG: hypothetical protein Q8R04_05905 [Nanoarchaeota archaeon]|nr:hypothetical protein [Nanoarchaeota archaeon]